MTDETTKARVQAALDRGDAPIAPDFLKQILIVDDKTGEKKRIDKEGKPQNYNGNPNTINGRYGKSMQEVKKYPIPENNKADYEFGVKKPDARDEGNKKPAENSTTENKEGTNNGENNQEKKTDDRDKETGEPMSKRQKKRGQFKNKERRNKQKQNMNEDNNQFPKSNTLSICPIMTLWNDCKKEGCRRCHDFGKKLEELKFGVKYDILADKNKDNKDVTKAVESAENTENKSPEEKATPHDEDPNLMVNTVYGNTQCPVFEAHGYCPAGINCAWWRAHCDEITGHNKVDCVKVLKNAGYSIEKIHALPERLRKGPVIVDLQDTTMEVVIKEMRKACSHLMDGFHETGIYGDDVKIQLRKKKYDFSLTDKVVKTVFKLTPKGGANNNEKKEENENKDAEMTNADDQKTEVPSPTSESTNVVIDSNAETAFKRAEKAKHYFKNKRVLAPLTTVGNLPFRRLCVDMGAEITVGEMALAESILQGSNSEAALLRRHKSEKQFGVQITAGNPQLMAKTAQFIEEHVDCDFIDINAACPLDQLHQKGCGSMLTVRTNALQSMILSMKSVLELTQSQKLLTCKIRMSHYDNENERNTRLHEAQYLIPKMAIWGVDSVILHGRTARQRYSKLANWDYLKNCRNRLISEVDCGFNNSDLHLGHAKVSWRDVVSEYKTNVENADDFDRNSLGAAFAPPLIGCGDVMNFNQHKNYIENNYVDSVMVGRGALIKPWIFSEIRDKKTLDISANERFDLIKKFVDYGLEHWGADERGVATTRRFLLEWLSFYHRYIPVGLLEKGCEEQMCINWRPASYYGRDDLETLLSSGKAVDWIRISEMFLGKVDYSKFSFVPKHKSAAY